MNTNSELHAALEIVKCALIGGMLTREQVIQHLGPLPEPVRPKVEPYAGYGEHDSKYLLDQLNVIVKSNSNLSAGAGKFLAETMARAKKYNTVKFSPKQKSWFDSLYQQAVASINDDPPF